MVALFGVLGFLIGIVVFVVSIMAMVRIITNAGYSGWWVLVPFAAPIVGYILGVILLASASLSGGSGQHFLGVAAGVFVIEFLCWFVSWGIFVKFAFADWPLLQQARGRQTPGGGFMNRGGYGGGTPGGNPAGPVAPYGAPAGFPPPPVGGPGPDPSAGPPPQADPGWFRSGMVGAGEQSYWDGSAWTARRRWLNNAWVDLPMEPFPAESPPEITH